MNFHIANSRDSHPVVPTISEVDTFYPHQFEPDILYPILISSKQT